MAMQNVNFLPAKYRELDAQRRRQIWRIAVLLMFGAVVGASAMFQRSMRRTVEDQLVKVEVQRAAAEVKHQQLGQLQTELQSARDAAMLYTYLQHPWPRTQILAEVVRQLPETIELTNIELERQRRPNLAPAKSQKGFGGQSTEQSEQSKQSPALRDLTLLRDEADASDTVVRLSGTTADPAQLHQFVARLALSPLFRKAELGSLESLEQTNPTGLQAQFTVRLVLRPGYGQPSGPERPLSSAASYRAVATELRP